MASGSLIGNLPIPRLGRGIGGALLASVALSGCSLFGQTDPFAGAVPVGAPATPVVAPQLPEPNWTPSTKGSAGVLSDHRVVATEGFSITVTRFRAKVTTLNLHVGSEDPVTRPGQVPANATNSINAVERPVLVGAFNGGFKHPADLGGFLVNGVTIHPLVPGISSLVLYMDGSVGIGKWGSTVPDQAKQVRSVRQNLPVLLVDHAAVTSSASMNSVWGGTIGTSPVVARSGVGVDAKGSVIVANSMHATPRAIATALQVAGAVTALETDINPYWVTLGLSATPGGPMTAQVPGEWHAPTIFQTGWTRDFFVVVARNQVTCAPSFGTAQGVNVLHQRCTV